ncbi:MAG TPA: ABC transporter permease [Acidobacteriota bacterium]|nr:ABC transporter permease [Acidobacteriota bacterium]HOT01443.1 ABC transporter permease [Acidobacteriota bacterium]HQF87309.1 ABC transporter permease [Acidobacteriota bacterium]HQG91883.1 ABC transporter permease [Acidobacteriota bacterium]HQK87651.1 ABC transporter permease [Acidobacteriota bacterium]
MFDRFAWSVALRNLRYNLGKTLLMMGVVAVSVTLIIFLGALIGGLQRRLIASVTGAIPHVVMRQPERVPLSVADTAAPDGPLYAGERIRLERQKRKIEDWPFWLARLQRFDPDVAAVSPVVEGQGFMSRGARRQGVAVVGVIPERHNEVVDIQSKLVTGRFFGLNAGEVALGYKLADEFSLRLGDKVRLVSIEGNAGTYTVAGIFDSGFAAVDGGTLYLTLRDGQTLFGVGTAVTSIGLKLGDIFGADAMARRLALQVPYETRSWMEDNQSLLSGLRAQSQSSNLIVGFTILGAGFGIASMLIMSVMSQLREIGILKAMGANRRQITAVFTVEGVLLSLFGGAAGAVQGSALCLWLAGFRTTASATGRLVETFPIDLGPALILGSIAIAVGIGFLASLYPAWRAARVNPIDVIRGA